MKILGEIIKVAIVGPESTGKSTVASYLAKQYDTVCVPEFARKYCEGMNRDYTLEDEMNIFHGQLELERQILTGISSGLVFMDTMILTVKIWCDHLFGFTPEPVLSALHKAQYDFYLLMDIDLPWEDDELRDFPNLREHFKNVWIRELSALGARYAIVKGIGTTRLLNAKSETECFLRSRAGN